MLNVKVPILKISYVLPNTSQNTSKEVVEGKRGGLSDRRKKAIEYGNKTNVDFKLVEIPADFIKNQNEADLTRLNEGDPISEETVERLYKKEGDIDIKGIGYILHTEPQNRPRNRLRWIDKDFREEYANALIAVSKRFNNIPPNMIEMHPGLKRHSSKEGIIETMKCFIYKYYEEFGFKPVIVIENRTDQIISVGSEIKEFWDYLGDNDPELKDQVGVALDVSQLFTMFKREKDDLDFYDELSQVPKESVKEFHIHFKHSAPGTTEKDIIPWFEVFKFIKSINREEIIINPEVLSDGNIEKTVNFVEQRLKTTVTE